VIQSVDKKPRLLKKNINQPASNVLDLFLRCFLSSGQIFILKMLLANTGKPFRHWWPVRPTFFEATIHPTI